MTINQPSPHEENRSLDRVVTAADNLAMTEKNAVGGKRKARKVPRMNQFGNEMAEALPTTVYAWKCSECGHIMPLADSSKPPVRCSNRKGGCGRLFHNEDP